MRIVVPVPACLTTVDAGENATDEATIKENADTILKDTMIATKQGFEDLFVL